MRTHKGSCGNSSVRHRGHGRRVHYRCHWGAALFPWYHQQEANDTVYRLSFPSIPPVGSYVYGLSQRGGLAELADAPGCGYGYSEVLRSHGARSIVGSGGDVALAGLCQCGVAWSC